MNDENLFRCQEVIELWDAFGKEAQSEAFHIFDQQIEDLIKFVKAYKDNYEKLSGEYVSGADELKHLQDFVKRLYVLLNKTQSRVKAYELKILAEGYVKVFESHTKQLSTKITKREVFSAYHIHPKDRPGTTVRKMLDNFKFSAGYVYKKTINLPRKLFRLKAFNLQTYRRRNVPFKAMVIDFLSIGLNEKLSIVLHETMKGKSQVLFELWKFDEDIENGIQQFLVERKSENQTPALKPEEAEILFADLLEKLKLLKQQFRTKVDEAVLLSFQELDKAFTIVDTPDLPLQNFNARTLAVKRNQLNAKNTLGFEKWKNTHTTLFDDWASDVEIMLLYFSEIDIFIEIREKINAFISTKLTLNFDKLRDFIKDSSARIQTGSTTVKNVKTLLLQERKSVNEDLIDKLLSQTVQKLSGSFIEDLEKFKSKTLALVGQISDRRGFIKSSNYERGIRNSEINYISPRELLHFEALPHLVKAIEEIRLLVEDSMERVRVKLLAMGTVSDFSLESAMMLLEQKKGAVKGSVKIAVEGYERAINHLDRAMSHANTIREEPLERLQKAIHEFNIEIQKLKNTENILELNIKIAKIKAIERSRKARQDAVNWVREIIPVIIALAKKRYVESSWMVEKFKGKIGLGTQKQQISFEISQFIRETRQALKKLPYVYQRLYQLRPTDEDRFFVNRNLEYEALASAFEDWTKDRFVTTALTGEKGSGLTSFIGFFLRKVETEIPVIHQTVKQRIYTQDDYFAFFASILDVEKFNSNQEIIDHLNEQGKKMMIILENLHYFYLKKINGFECQKLIFDLMSHTAKQVFWVGTYTIHSWEYLNKTLGISNYFVREIRLEQMNDETLKEIILKRNHLSGYKINFMPSDLNLESRSFKNLDERGKQQFLRKQYFNGLRSISNGNISLAQLYWLRSTQEISDDSISIAYLRELDVSFVKGLPNDHVFALHAILVHDGLTLSDYAMVFNLPENTCRQTLIPMLEKGLLIRPKEKFNINPIIFRQVVSLLHSRNFIY